MNFFVGDHGSAALTTALILPLLIIVLTGALELGRLRVVAQRVRSAADLATIIAVGDQDDEAITASGAYRPSPDAEAVARVYLVQNLSPIASELVDPVEAIAADAQVVVLDAGVPDPSSGRTYDRPVVHLSARVRVKSPGLAALLLSPITDIDVFAASVTR